MLRCWDVGEKFWMREQSKLNMALESGIASRPRLVQIYVLDEEGVIRRRGPRHEAVITAAKELVGDMRRKRAHDPTR